MQISVLTLFPEIINNSLHGIIKRAFDQKIAQLNVVNIRDFSKNNYHSVDDRTYGGGIGMIMSCQPIFDGVSSCPPGRVILLDPQGKKFTQKDAVRLSKYKHLILICGHYEGVDQRVKDHLANEAISIGDYVLTGGEIPAMVIIDSIVRLLPGVLKKGVTENESFSEKLNPKLEYPQYTRPEVFKGWKVPKVLLSGNHKKIESWREKHKKTITT